MRTVMLDINHFVSNHSKFINVSIYRGLNLMYLVGFIDEKNARGLKDQCSVGMWKIKKIK